MFKIISIIALILSIVLFPPTALALVSQNAIPGEMMYPVKRGLEDGILAITSITPQSKAWFALARSQRRYKEATGLINKDKDAKKSLDELVSQSKTALSDIKNLQNPAQRQEYAAKLAQELQAYDRGLAQIEQQLTPKEEFVPLKKPGASSTNTQPQAQATTTPVSQTGSPSQTQPQSQPQTQTQPQTPTQRASGPAASATSIPRTTQPSSSSDTSKQVGITREELQQLLLDVNNIPKVPTSDATTVNPTARPTDAQGFLPGSSATPKATAQATQKPLLAMNLNFGAPKVIGPSAQATQAPAQTQTAANANAPGDSKYDAGATALGDSGDCDSCTGPIVEPSYCSLEITPTGSVRYEAQIVYRVETAKMQDNYTASIETILPSGAPVVTQLTNLAKNSIQDFTMPASNFGNPGTYKQQLVIRKGDNSADCTTIQKTIVINPPEEEPTQ